MATRHDVTPDDVAEALSRVTAALPGGGEDRPGQLQMAQAVARAIQEKRHLVVQAGTGTGKSLAYLIPCVLGGVTCVVATATKALQDQLAGKDLPFLAAHLGRPFRFAVLKGRSNYLCLQKGEEIAEREGAEQLELADADTADLGRLGREIVQILRWARTNHTGDRAELDFEPHPRAWASLSVTARECPGASRCPKGELCRAEAAHERAAAADVIVVNTHLYAMHLASGGHLLPPHEVVVFDEAHALEDIVAAAMGVELTAGRFTALARTVRSVAGDDDVAGAVDDAGLRLTSVLGQHTNARVDATDDEELAAVLVLCRDRLGRATAALRAADSEADSAARTRAMKAVTSLVDDVDAAAETREHLVAWVEGPVHAPVMKVAPIDVAGILADRLWASGIEAATLTSATIPPFLPRRLGLAEGTYTELDVGSPFDFANHAVLYCAAHLPDPRHPDYEPAMHAELDALIRAAGGRTLALFTSWRAMRAAADALRDALPWRVMTQDELPKPALLEAFSTDETSCLFATMGFWQGVDVPGAALSLVAIDRLPFSRPDEPLLQARRERAGADAFRVIDLPRAATLLAQGAGRLIRSSTDRGVVAVLDSRLARAGYRSDLLRAMPPMRLTALRANVERFLAAD
ncbi:MAG: ATP-dependent DNA helicase [Actinobacteria bacterium]|nr:MAG: ATP-dependent DNA helicase [Actinomycetota bacterium]